MGGKKAVGENSKKAAGQARKADAAASKKAAEDNKKAAVDEAEWDKGSKKASAKKSVYPPCGTPTHKHTSTDQHRTRRNQRPNGATLPGPFHTRTHKSTYALASTSLLPGVQPVPSTPPSCIPSAAPSGPGPNLQARHYLHTLLPPHPPSNPPPPYIHPYMRPYACRLVP